jgi:hypothetical protein
MSHKHYCDVAGHEWVCDSNECVCICQIQMESGDHNQCSIELRACPAHPYASATDPRDNHGRLEIPDNIDEMILNWASSSEHNIGWCLLCDSPIRNEADLIPGTQTHQCGAGRALHAAGRSY